MNHTSHTHRRESESSQVSHESGQHMPDRKTWEKRQASQLSSHQFPEEALCHWWDSWGLQAKQKFKVQSSKFKVMNFKRAQDILERILHFALWTLNYSASVTYVTSSSSISTTPSMWEKSSSSDSCWAMVTRRLFCSTCTAFLSSSRRRASYPLLALALSIQT